MANEGDEPALSDDSADSDELDALLKQVARAPVYAATERGARDPRAMRRADSDDSADEELGGRPSIGDEIDGKYRIESLVGEGGMGVVFAATQLNTGGKVALKWMLTEGASLPRAERLELASRFVREARAAARIRHDHCVDIYDVGGSPEAPYLVMELLEGTSLRAARATRAPMPWDDALAIMLPVLSVIETAHTAGVLHRDLKPDNIFLEARPGMAERPKVLDFGISRIGDSAGESDATLTRTGAVLGTPAYMPLEQLRGTGKIDARADVYALGVILYELLCGERPYKALNAADYAAALASEEPRPLSEHRPDLVGPRADAVMAALRPIAEQRTPSVAALTAAWSSAADEARVGPAWRGPRVRALALGLAIALLVTVAALAWLGGNGPASPPVSETANGSSATPAPPLVSASTPPSSPANAPAEPAAEASAPEVMPDVEPAGSAGTAGNAGNAGNPDDLSPRPRKRSRQAVRAPAERPPARMRRDQFLAPRQSPAAKIDPGPAGRHLRRDQF